MSKGIRSSINIFAKAGRSVIALGTMIFGPRICNAVIKREKAIKKLDKFYEKSDRKNNKK